MKTCLATFMTAVLLAASVPAHGNGGDSGGKDLSLIRKVPELKQACEAASKHGWESGITAQIMNASFAYHDCLIGIIEQILDTYYPADNRDFVKRVRDIASDIYALYWDIYCLGEEWCGSMYKIMSTGPQSGFIEDVLKTMVVHLELEMQ